MVFGEKAPKLKLAKVRWEADTNTEHVRIDFETAINVPTQDGGLPAHNRYLLRRTEQRPPAQWLFLPALRRVRIMPYQPDNPLLQSDFLFYDLPAIQNFGDYRYRFLDLEPDLSRDGDDLCDGRYGAARALCGVS